MAGFGAGTKHLSYDGGEMNPHSYYYAVKEGHEMPFQEFRLRVMKEFGTSLMQLREEPLSQMLFYYQHYVGLGFINEEFARRKKKRK